MKKITENTIDQILLYKMVMGKSSKETALTSGTSENTVNVLIRAYNSIKDENWTDICTLAERGNTSLATIEYLARVLEKMVPICVLDAYRERNKKYSNIMRKKRGSVPETAPEISTDNTGLYLIKILEALTAQNELLTQLCDAVIPHWTVDLKENINANSDVIGQRLDNMVQILDGIRCNTRKRGT